MLSMPAAVRRPAITERAPRLAPKRSCRGLQARQGNGRRPDLHNQKIASMANTRRSTWRPRQLGRRPSSTGPTRRCGARIGKAARSSTCVASCAARTSRSSRASRSVMRRRIWRST
jgi:hypothetical protein